MSSRIVLWSVIISSFFFVRAGEGADIVQAPGSDALAFQAEILEVTILNPDSGNDVQYSVPIGAPESPSQVWTDILDASASGGRALKAPPSPHKQLSDTSLQEAIAAYALRFVTAGTYATYLRVRNDGTDGSGSTDSLWQSSDWNQTNPSLTVTTGQTGGYEWRKPSGGSLVVSAGQVNTTLDFRLGVREPDAHVDGVVFSQDTGLSDAELDALLLAGTSPPPTNQDFCVASPAELADAIAAAQPGETIFMCNGIWDDTDILFETDGTPNQPITLQASTPGQVFLTGQSKLRIAGDYLVVKGLHFTSGHASGGDNVIEFRDGSHLANNSRLTECAITSFNPADPATNYKWVSIYGQSNRVDHCAFTGMNHIGVTLTIWLGTGAPANHTRIDANYFGERTQGSENGHETIRIGTSTRSMQDSEAVVESNYFYRCDGEIEIISSKSGGNVYRYNTFEECKGQLTLRHGNECVVEGNFFLGNNVSDCSGVRVIGEDHVVVNNYFFNLRGTGYRAALAMMNGVPSSPLNEYFQVQRALIAFNTFVGCRENFVIGIVNGDGTATLPPLDCVVANNIVKGSDAPLIEYITTPINMQYEGDIFYGASLGITPPSGIAQVDPDLVLAADGLMRPASGSPALDAAAGSYPTVLDDMDGDPRVSGTQDIGADEEGTGPPLRRPLTAVDVGPRWMKPNQTEILDLDISGGSASIQFHDAMGLAARYAVDESSNLETGGWNEVGAYAPDPATSLLYQVSVPTTNDPLAIWRIRAD